MTDKHSKMIFVTGASRSGTTLLSFILRANSRVCGLKELHYFGDLCDPADATKTVSDSKLVDAAAELYRRQQNGMLANGRDATARSWAKQLVASLRDEQRTMSGLFLAVVNDICASAGKVVPCEHTPRNIYYAEDLLELYPQAQIVHLTRDPRGVMASQKQRWQRRRLAANQESFPLTQTLRVWVNYHPYTIARLWRQANQRALELQAHDRFTLVTFEDLLLDSKSVVQELCGRLGIEFEPAMLDVGQVNSSHQSSVGGARRGFNASTVDAWRDCLSPEEVAITEEMCGDLMQEFGYSSYRRTDSGGRNRIRYQVGYLLHLAGVLAINPKRAWIQTRALLSGTSNPRKAQH